MIINLVIGCFNTYFVWTGKLGQTPVDKWLKVKTVYEESEEEESP